MRPYLVPILVLVACTNETSLEHNTVRAERPTIAVEVVPNKLAFSTLAKDGEETATFQVRNTGDVTVEVGDMAVDGGSFSLIADPSPLDLEPGEEVEVTVRFSPHTHGALDGLVEVRTDVEGSYLLDVALVGQGQAPVFVATPDPVDFGSLPILCGYQDKTLKLKNTGGHDLRIDSVTWSGSGQLEALSLPSAPRKLAPGTHLEASFRFNPAEVASESGTLIVETDDPAGATKEILQLGEAVFPFPEVTESFDVGLRDLDILLAMDRSCSMRTENPVVEVGFRHLIQQIDDVLAGWQIGVVTGISPCFNEGILTSDTPDLEETLIHAMQGEKGPLTEALLELAYDAIYETQTCNTGFLRGDKPLQIIVISDEPEQSAMGWESIVDDITGFVGDPDRIHISGVLDLNRQCGTGADGYIQAADDTGGVTVDLCLADLTAEVMGLLEPSQLGVDFFALADPPVETSISVEVDGAAVSDWSYHAARQGIAFDEAPEAGAEVTVRYRPAGCP